MLTRVLTQVYTRVPTKVGFLCVIIPYKGSHSSAHVSAHAGAHASVHEVVWSYVTWSVFACSVPHTSKYRAWGFLGVLSRGISGEAQSLRSAAGRPSRRGPSSTR